MSIFEFVVGLILLVGFILLITATYLAKDEKGGVNAAFDGASDFMAKRRDNRNKKINRFVTVWALVVSVLIVVVTIYGSHA